MLSRLSYRLSNFLFLWGSLFLALFLALGIKIAQAETPASQSLPPHSALILILTTPDLSTPPEGYTVLKTLKATAQLPTEVQGPLDNPALKNIIDQANAIQASALLGLNCQTNGKTIACSSLALAHDFSKPSRNIFDSTAHALFGDHFYTQPLHFPPQNKIGAPISVTFYFNPEQYREVSGENIQQSNAWWGLKKESITVKNPTIPALCVDALYFLKQLNLQNPKSPDNSDSASTPTGLVNFNCFLSTSTLPGYVQINAAASGVQ
jgi:hypothetical protein